MLGAISPRALARTLEVRGIRIHSVESVDAYVNGLDPDGRAWLLRLLHDIERGVEDTHELDKLLEGFSTAVGVAAPTPDARSAAKPNLPQRQDLSTLRAYSTHVWATSAAMSVELTPLEESRSEAPPTYSVRFEAARKVDGAYDWKNKIIVQLTRSELPTVGAFVLGFAGARLELSGHGEYHDKSLTLEDQGHKLFARLSQRGAATIALPVPPAETCAIGEVLLAALQLNRPLISPTAHEALLRRVGDMQVKRPAPA